MKRQTLDDYLDGTLDSAAIAQVQQTLAADAAASHLLKVITSERALRTAAYNSYTPSNLEASALTSQFFAACEDDAATPVGRIQPAPARAWLRYAAGIAAGLGILIGAFAMGRATAPASTGIQTAAAEPKTIYKVVVMENAVPQEVLTVASTEELNAFISQLRERGITVEQRGNTAFVNNALAMLDDHGTM